jgi:transcriptional regulator with XRE-family HTH domain
VIDVPKRQLRRASELTEEFLRDPTYQAIFDEVVGEEIGAALRAVREAKRLSQADVAKHMGVSRSRISQIEGAEGTALSLDVLQRYSNALECYVDISVRDLSTNTELGQIYVAHSGHAPEIKDNLLQNYQQTGEHVPPSSPVIEFPHWPQAA